MTQYTFNFLRVPPSYPGDMIGNTYDPYLDGAYTPPEGDAAHLYLVEYKLLDYFSKRIVESILTLGYSIPLLPISIRLQAFQLPVTLVSLQKSCARITLNQSSTRPSLESDWTENQETGLSLFLSLDLLQKTVSVIALSITPDIMLIQSPTTRPVLNVSATMDSLNSSTSRVSLSLTQIHTLLETTFNLS